MMYYKVRLELHSVREQHAYLLEHNYSDVQESAMLELFVAERIYGKSFKREKLMRTIFLMIQENGILYDIKYEHSYILWQCFFSKKSSAKNFVNELTLLRPADVYFEIQPALNFHRKGKL